MDSNTDLPPKLTYYSTSSSVSKMPKHMVSSQAVNKESPSSARKNRKESATQAHRNKPCQTENCRGKLVSTGVNYEQPNTSSSSAPQSNQQSQASHPYCMPPPPPPSCYPPPSSCYPAPPPPSCYPPPPPPPRPCFMPPSCYPPPPPPHCPRSRRDSQHSQQSQNFMPYPCFYPSPDKPCWFRPPPPCPYPLYPQYDMSAQQQNQHMTMNDQDFDRDQWQQPHQMKQCALMPSDSRDAAYDLDVNDGFDMNDTVERDFNLYNDEENFEENLCSDCRVNDNNDEEQLWQEQLSMQRPHCSPPPSFTCYPPPPPVLPQCFPRNRCCPARKRHCKKMQDGADMRNIECDHCKAKTQNMECNHCKNKGKEHSQQSAKGPESEYQHQYSKKTHKRY